MKYFGFQKISLSFFPCDPFFHQRVSITLCVYNLQSPSHGCSNHKFSSSEWWTHYPKRSRRKSMPKRNRESIWKKLEPQDWDSFLSLSIPMDVCTKLSSMLLRRHLIPLLPSATFRSPYLSTIGSPHYSSHYIMLKPEVWRY